MGSQIGKKVQSLLLDKLTTINAYKSLFSYEMKFKMSNQGSY